MKKVNLLLVALMAIIFASCEKDTTMTANITWEDKDWFELEGETWMAVLYDDAIIRWEDSDYEKSPLASKTIDFETETVSFSHAFSSAESFTIVVFADKNENGKFDEGENSYQDYNVITAGDDTDFEIKVNY